MSFLIRCLVLTLALGATAHAADPVFPPGSRIGLVPPPGMVPSATFPGFENRELRAAILIAELPPQAYAAMEQSLNLDALKVQGFAPERRESVPIQDGRGFLLVGQQDVAGTSLRKWLLLAELGGLTALVTAETAQTSADEVGDTAMQVALTSIAVRATVPVEEELAILPYRIKDLAGFRIVHALAAGAALLTDGPGTTLEVADQPLILINITPGGPDQPSDRGSFARRMVAETPGVKDMRLVRSEPLRIGGVQGFETVVDAKDAKTDADVKLVQWLRFGTVNSLRILAVARADAWEQLFPRFRALRDAVEPK